MIAGEALNDMADPLLIARVRALSPQDLDAVSDLFLKLFRRGRPRRKDVLTHYLSELFFGETQQKAFPSGQVYTSPTGRLAGFIGGINQPMVLDGTPMSGMVGCGMMLDPGHGDALALFRLLRAILHQGQGFSSTDTAAPISRDVLERVGAVHLPLHSLDWLLVLSRGAYLAGVFADRFRNRTVTNLLGAAAQAFQPRAEIRLPRGGQAALRFFAPSTDELAAALARLSRLYALRPDWSAADPHLRGRLAEAARRRRHGVLKAMVATDAAGEPLACWLAYLRRGGVAQLLQVLAVPQHMDAALANLAATAAAAGAVAVRGRAQPEQIAALTRMNASFRPVSSTLIHAADARVLRACHEASHNALLTGLAGESWTRLIDDDFR